MRKSYRHSETKIRSEDRTQKNLISAPVKDIDLRTGVMNIFFKNLKNKEMNDSICFHVRYNCIPIVQNSNIENKVFDLF